MESEWEKFRKKIVDLQGDLGKFEVHFLDRDAFKEIADRLSDKVGYENICITGYFSETIRNQLELIIRYSVTKKVRLICPELDVSKTRDKKNLQVLRKLVDVGAEIKVNYRLHARFMVAYTQSASLNLIGGLLLIGSFDFNTECIGKERYDAGIMTRHPDLVHSAIQLFEQIWNEEESKTLSDRYKN